MSNRSFKFFAASAAVFLFTFAINSQADAQGFRIGNAIQAGGGQGFRMGGPKIGMHFGGGQGTTIGTANFGMRFGNGQGARFGGATYGMQFGGQQGTQIGQFSTTPAVAPGTYYYGDVRNPGQPGIAQPGYAPNQPTLIQPTPRTAQPTLIQPTSGAQPTLMSPTPAAAQPTLIQPTPAAGQPPAVPTLADPNLSRTNPGSPNKLPTLAAPSPTDSVKETQRDIAAPALIDSAGKVEKTETSATKPTLIRLKHNLAAKSPMEYTLNGSTFSLAPGESVILQNGQTWTVNFAAGGSLGRRQADLANAGTFSFFETPDEGWILIKESPVTSVRTVSDEEASEKSISNPARTDAPIDSPFDVPDGK